MAFGLTLPVKSVTTKWAAVVAMGAFFTGCPETNAGRDGAVDVVDSFVPNDFVDATVMDVKTSEDVMDEGPCILEVSAPDAGGRSTGYIRFVNAVRGAGTLRFRARNLPMFARAYVEAVVPEGTSTEHILTLPVAYEVRVEAAGDASTGYTVDADFSDGGGLLTDGPGAPQTTCNSPPGVGEVAPPFCTDVYFFAGCTIVFSGSTTEQDAGGVVSDGGAPDAAVRISSTAPQMHRIADLTGRSNDCSTSNVRFFNWNVHGPLLNVTRDVNAGAEPSPLANMFQYSEPTGTRLVPAGPLSITVRNAETRELVRTLPLGTLAPGFQYTVHLWGDARNQNSAVDAILLNDISPTFR
jgi:hypothetical protein